MSPHLMVFAQPAENNLSSRVLTSLSMFNAPTLLSVPLVTTGTPPTVVVPTLV